MEKNKKERTPVDAEQSRKVFLIIGSILAAIAIWFYVDTVKVTNVTTTVRNIPVEFVGENTVLADNGLMLLSGYDTTIDLRLKGPRKVLWKLNKEQIRIVADTSKITDTGIQSLHYQVIYPDNVQPNSIQVEYASSYSVTVTVGELDTKEIPIHCEVVGEIADGFLSEELVLDPVQLVLHAQRDDLLNVAYAKIKLDVSGAQKTVTKALEFQLYDYNDIPIKNENIRAATNLIQATLPVKSMKRVPLKLNFIEAPGSTLAQMDYSIDPATVVLVGDKDILDSVDEIVLDTIYLQDLAESQSLRYTVPMPEGCYLKDESEQVATVTIVVKGISEQTITANNFILENIPDGFVATPVTDQLEITVRGIASEVAALTGDKLQITANLGDISEEGSFTVPVTITVPGTQNVGIKGSYQIIVNVSKPTT